MAGEFFQVHATAGDALSQELHNRFHGDAPHVGKAFRTVEGRMRGQDQPPLKPGFSTCPRCDQRMRSVGRFCRQNVEAGSAKPVRSKCTLNRIQISDAAARRVDENGTRLHRGERGVIDQPLGLGRQRAVKRDDVALGQQIMEGSCTA